MEYVIIGLITIIFFYLAIKVKNSKNNYNKGLYFIFIILTILVPSIFAGIRSIYVGTDTYGYLLADYNISSNATSFFEAITSSNEELGFISIVFFINKIFGNIHLVMFLIELIIMTFIVKYAIKAESEKEALTIVSCYMILSFGESLCIMRQHISYAILLYSLRLFDNKKYIRCSILFIISYLFHSSSICFLFIYILINMNKKNNINKLKKRYIFIIILTVAFIINVDVILNILINKLGILPSRYNLYISSTWFYSTKIENIITLRFILDALFIILYIISYNLENNLKNKKKILFSLFLMIINLILYVCSRKYLILSRFSIYFFTTAIMINPLFIKNIQYSEKSITTKKELNKLILRGAFIFLILSTFYGVVIANTNNYNLYPYKTFYRDYE